MNPIPLSPNPIKTTSMARNQLKKKGVHTLEDFNQTKQNEEAIIEEEIYNTDLKIEKEEIFDTDAMNALLIDPAISTADRKRLSLYNRGREGINSKIVIYSYAKGNFAKHQLGRLYAKSKDGIQSFPKQIRDPLQAKYYYDIDMENAHFRIIAKYGDDLSVNTKPFYQYINNRAEELKKISENKLIGKVAFLKILYGGDIDAPIDCVNDVIGDTDKLQDQPKPEGDITLLYQIKHITNTIADIVWSKNEQLHYIVKDKKYNKKHSLLSHILQTEERKALLALDNFLKTKGRRMDTFIHDGGRIRKTDEEVLNKPSFPIDLLREGEKAILKKTGYNHKLAEKLIPPFIPKPDARIYEPVNAVINDAYATDKLLEFLEGKIAIDISNPNAEKQTIRIFNENNGLWETGAECLSRAIDKKIRNKMIFYQYQIDGKVKSFDYGGNETQKQKVIKQITSNRNSVYRNFSNESDTSKGKLLFSDGIYDFTTKLFTEGFNSKIIFNGRIDRPYPKNIDIELINKVNKILFIDPFTKEQIENEVNEFYKQGLARCIYGEYEAKRCYFGVGQANSGRGLLTASFVQAFGGNNGFCGTFNMNNLLEKPGNTDDEAKKNAWLIPIANKRLSFANEVKITGILDGGALKSAVSGGDQIKARLLNDNEQTIIVRTGLVLLTNDIPKIIPCDKGISNRSCVLEYSKAFVESINNPNEILQDITLLSYMKKPEVSDAIVCLMIKSYNKFVENGSNNEKPSLIKKVSERWLETNASVESVFKSVYEITRSPTDFVPLKDILYLMVDKKIKDSTPKIQSELVRMGLVWDNKNKNHQVRYYGCKLIEYDKEDDCMI